MSLTIKANDGYPYRTRCHLVLVVIHKTITYLTNSTFHGVLYGFLISDNVHDGVCNHQNMVLKILDTLDHGGSNVLGKIKIH